MAERIQSITRAGSTSWSCALSGTAPWRVYKDGVLLETVAFTPFVVEGTDTEEPPAVEVLDATDTQTPDMLAYPQFARLQWRGYATADYYKVERYESGAWGAVATVRETGRGYYAYTTPVLPDGTEVDYRITAIDEGGNASTAAEMKITLHRNPDPPSITATYAGGNLTVSTRT